MNVCKTFVRTLVCIAVLVISLTVVTAITGTWMLLKATPL